MSKKVITNNLEETQKLGLDFAKKAQELQVIALHGDLGSGKTTFVQGLAKGLGITKQIISPTFIIMRTYKIDGRAEKKFLYHVDLYRITDERDINALGLPELMEDTQNIFVVEWPEKIKKFFSDKKVNLYFSYIDENKREIHIT